MNTGSTDMMMPPKVPALKMALTKPTKPLLARKMGGITIKARHRARLRISRSDRNPSRSMQLVRKLSAMAQKEVSMAQKAKKFTNK